MASIFRRDDNYVEQPKRNTVDFSFQNNMTTDFGSLRPCMCVPVMPGDSWRIRPTFGLKFLPMRWPVQTRMKASIHYFYVRNRNLWKDWPDFIGKTKQGLIPPYIHLTEQNRKQIETCQLGDFLGMPTKIYGQSYQEENYTAQRSKIELTDGMYVESNQGASSNVLQAVSAPPQLGDIIGTDFTNPSSGIRWTANLLLPIEEFTREGKFTIRKFNYMYRCRVAFFNTIGVCVHVTDPFIPVQGDYEFDNPIDASWDVQGTPSRRPDILVCIVQDSSDDPGIDASVSVDFLTPFSETLDVADLPLSRLPYRSSANPSGIPISALPFRAYEAIYNVFYRNAENNPLLINGVPEYNKWNRTLEGGSDENFYPIEYHNWEDDFLTTAVPSPQQGNAPLVGLSGTSTVTIGHEDGTTTEMAMEVDESGNVTAASAISGDEATQAALIEAVSYGISINDFRNVNSFQRWLENNIRRGYKYKDQIKTHYGVSVRYDELDMPEFIGGTSQPVMVNQISQTTPTDSEPLGAMAGQASSVGQGSEITHYCDEHGFIIGILCVKPVANYSQLLPKYFNVTDTFDYYFPEFGHIGMQPITYSEVAPLQANLEGKLNDVFGYQRAWYDLISKTDEVHGLFRSDFRNFLINRTFDGTPELGKEFTVMDPNQINDVFAYTENTDKILGQIYMEISKKTPIPLYGIPKLE